KVAAAVLGIDESSNLDLLAKALIGNGHTVSLAQIELLIEQVEMGEEAQLRTDGYANFFFVEDKNGSVSVVDVRRYDRGRWNVRVHRLGYGIRWGVAFRFFSRN
ncbi:hypothetical protein KW799_02540, partial [Candidatus Parcubacteria bacterium]|nr:hypothetical protein [Candidatus Parcubacteria bacterium]